MAFFIVLIGIPIKRVVERRARLYSLSTERKVFLHVYSTLENLESFRGSDSLLDRSRAVEEAKKALDGVKGWKIAGLELVRQTVGKYLVPFKRNFEDKLLPAIEEGDEENLKRSSDFLENFARYLIDKSPTVRDIDELNSTLVTITTIPSEKPIGFRARLFGGKTGHVLALTSCCLAGLVAFCLGRFVLEISLEGAYLAGVTLAGMLVGSYLNYARK